MMTASPNPITVAWSMWRSLRTVRPPRPQGSEQVVHDALVDPLRELAALGPRALADIAAPVEAYVAHLETVDPDQLDRTEAIALWINLYNAGALLLAAEAIRNGEDSVLRLPGGFRRPFVAIAGEHLSLDAVEHAKLRRFGDPRIHGALVCGSVSCPTLRAEPYRGVDLSRQLDDQMRHLLSRGAASVDTQAQTVALSRVFLWYGSDFVRPHRMPSLLPVRRKRVLAALRPWLDPDLAAWIDRASPRTEFMDYDWGLACSVA
jgi:hypothetical protein